MTSNWPQIVIEQPPKVEFGEYALPLSFELAKQLRKAPRKIAEEIVAEHRRRYRDSTKLEVAGAGYINARVNRGEFAAALLKREAGQPPVVEPAEHARGKVLVEHTSINPNKAAHIGHLRNAILGDTFVRLLRAAGRAGGRAELHRQHRRAGGGCGGGLRCIWKRSREPRCAERCIAIATPRFDYYCWDLYARVSQWYEQRARAERCRCACDTLHAIEAGRQRDSPRSRT